jgi:plasmid segregation protein ParM
VCTALEETNYLKGGLFMLQRRSKLASLDLGYGFTKVDGDGRTWSGASVVGEVRPLHDDTIKNNDIVYSVEELNTVYHKMETKEEYFISDLALRQSKVIYATTKDDKSNTWTTSVLARVALSLIDPYGDFFLVTGLPVDFYFKQRAAFETMMANLNEQPEFKLQVGRVMKYSALPKIATYRDADGQEKLRLKIVPQPLGAAMNFLLDDQGNIIDNAVADKDLLIIDIGYYTLDLLDFLGMEIGKGACSPPGCGIDMAYQLIQDYLKEAVGKAPDRYSLDKYVRAGEYEGFNINPLIEKAFQVLGEKISLEIANLNTHYYRYIVTGGWAQRIVKYIDIPQDQTIVYDHTGNVKGYRKIGIRAWSRVAQ